MGSGSRGNATLLSDGQTSLLMDAGLSYRQMRRRLEMLGVEPEAIEAILITHAHRDHVRGAAHFSTRHETRVYATEACQDAWGADRGGVREWRTLTPGRAVRIGALWLRPFIVPHDATTTLGFRIESPEGAIGFATDVGHITAELVGQFQGCRMVVLESNHAAGLLRVGPYAPSVKSRIDSQGGHLSNEAVARFVTEHLDDSVACLVLAHLSQVNNVPEIAAMTCREALDRSGRRDVRVIVAGQDRPAETVDLQSLAPVWVRDVASRPGLRQVRLPW